MMNINRSIATAVTLIILLVTTALAGSHWAISPVITVDTRDSDGDGLPDGWEMDHGLSEFSAIGPDGAEGDPDGDGSTNLQELMAGTHPNDAGSVLRVESVVKNGTGGFEVTWQSVPGKTYQVLYASNLGGPWQENLPASEVAAGVGETTKSYTDTTAGSMTKRFYRVRLVQP